MSQEEDPMAAYTTLVNLPHFLSSFTSLETGALVLFLVAVFTVQLCCKITAGAGDGCR